MRGRRTSPTSAIGSTARTGRSIREGTLESPPRTVSLPAPAPSSSRTWQAGVGEERRMNIYLACTVRGDRCGLTGARALADIFERSGHIVLTRHLLDDGVDAAESALTEREVFERDMHWLNTADLLIAE